MTYAHKIAQQLKLEAQRVAAAIELLDTDNTIPFIARYRKEVTGELDEEQIRNIEELLKKMRSLDERRETILRSIRDQDKLTEALKAQIEAAETNTELEDLYQPYKPKRKTRASVARDKGLQPLADMILAQGVVPEPLGALAQPYLNDQVPNLEEAWAGGRDIAAETISDDPEVRGTTRAKAFQWGVVESHQVKKAEDPRGVYQNYYDFEFRIERLLPHQILALNRGENEKVLQVKVNVPERDWRSAIHAKYPGNPQSPLAEQLELASEDAAGRLLLPAIDRDVRRALTEAAEAHAIQVFATNLRNLLNQPPLAGHYVMGIDPGFRTGCKVAIVDPTGKPLETATIYPHPPQNLAEKAQQTLLSLIKRHHVTLIAIGNGTASRETEALVAELIQINKLEEQQTTEPKRAAQGDLHYLIVSEAGASVYSASKLARSELPDMDVSMRGAVSIARRVQDPLAELVKIDPKSIGVGMYQHDIDQKKLGTALEAVVESAVNSTGVEVNSASTALLTFVSGIGPSLAARIIQYRDQHGPFPSKDSLREVPGLGPKAFEQAAGFLRIRGGDNPLDSSAIHPESYPIAEKVLQHAGLRLDSTVQARESALNDFRSVVNLEAFAAELGTGIPTLKDILEQLVQPGRDPREDLPAPILRSDVLKMEDLVTGMQLMGTIRNVVDFGAFVDIGVKHDGLLHRSQIPRETDLAVGEIIKVEILKVEIERGRISLGWVH